MTTFNVCSVFHIHFTHWRRVVWHMSYPSSYHHRSINVKKLVDIGYSYIPRNQTLAREVKLCKIPDVCMLRCAET